MPVSEQRETWRLLQPVPEQRDTLAAELDVHSLVATVLCNRGFGLVEQARRFLAPSLAELPDPYLMADAEKAAERVCQAIVGGERICVYGDYDVDGVSAASLLHQFFREVGTAVRVFLPDRFRDGYGVNAARIVDLCAEGVDLFISVDCGSNAVEPVRQAREAGCDFIICDHHQLSDPTPPANALMNPRRLDCTYPSKDLCAVGVALVLAQATRRKLADSGHFKAKPPALAPLLQFAALGTIADMVPLRDVNRLLAWHGLRRLGTSRLAGVRALAAKARLTGIDRADHVGFVLGPRINAAGRVADAKTAFELLTTDSAERANELAGHVELQNNKRRAIQKDVSEAALAQATEMQGTDHAVVIADPSWHAGVVGIVAARVKDRYAVPTFVLAIDGDVAKGSGRSVEGYDLVAGLRRLASEGLFERFGGHYFAAGVTMDAAKVPQFRAALVEDVRQHLSMEARHKVIEIDAEVPVELLTLATVDAMDCLEPHGRGNPRPKLLLRAVTVADKRFMGKDEAWVRLRLVEGGDRPLWARRGAAVFCSADQASELNDGDVVSAVVRLQRNHYRGDTTLQLSPVAFGPAEPAVSVVSASRQQN
jgi:single-stranded-DNA-specific exonuclease